MWVKFKKYKWAIAYALVNAVLMVRAIDSFHPSWWGAYLAIIAVSIVLGALQDKFLAERDGRKAAERKAAEQ